MTVVAGASPTPGYFATKTPDDVDIAALREKYRAERDKRLRADGSTQYLELTGDFAAYSEVDPHNPFVDRDQLSAKTDVLILGGGFAGLLTAVALKKAGVQDIRIIEMGGDFGGVWYWNRLPGVPCDNDSYCYITLLEELDYMPTKKFADGSEIFAHCQRIGKHFGLYDGAILSTQVRDLKRDDEITRWRIATNRGDDIQARFVVMAAGTFNRPKHPGIPGLADFTGHTFHSSRWDYGYTGGDATGCLEKLVKKTAVPNAEFETSCTPGYYNNEGGEGGEGIRSHLGEPYGPGFYAFGELLAQWRATGTMEGMELRS